MKRFLLSVCLAFGLSQAATLPYQGLATDAKGNPKPDASYQVDFALYSSATGVTPLWRESQMLSTRKGLFSTLLGSETLIPDSLFKGTALYLGVRFDGGSEGGRVLLGTTPWASAARTSVTSAFADSAGKVAGLSDSVAALRSTLASQTDSMKSLRDTVKNLRVAIAGLNATASSQSATIASLSSSVDALQALLLTSNGGISWNSAVNYGYFKDSRDGQVYRTVTIGTQSWMAQNLNYRNATGSSDTVGKCQSNKVDSCAKYGRLYTWAEVMKSALSSSASPSGVKGICPTGWHVPSDAEWLTLSAALGGESVAGAKLKSTSGWSSGTGSDASGFRALPGGYSGGPSFSSVGNTGYWWSATERDASYALSRTMSFSHASLSLGEYDKIGGFSLRCSKDAP